MSTKDQARYEVSKDDIIVHGARISCDCTGVNERPNYIIVTDGHGIMESGRNCAHDEDCIPIKNIQPFQPSCFSSYAKKALKELIPRATGDLKSRCQNALNVIERNERGDHNFPVPCALPLLDRWFDADEHSLVTDFMKTGDELYPQIQEIKTQLDVSIKAACDAMYVKYLQAEPKYADPYMDKWEDLLKIKSAIANLYPTWDEALTEIYMGNGNFKGTADRLGIIVAKLEEIARNIDTVQSEYIDMNQYNTIRGDLQTVIDNTKGIINKINNWKEKEYHLITMNSFLVCRCGGIITFKTSGQDYMDVTQTVLNTILEMIARFKDKCIYNRDHIVDEPKRYRDTSKAIEALKRFEALMSPSASPNLAKPDVPICMEITSRSYNDEITNRAMAVLSAIGGNSMMISGYCASVALKDAHEEQTDQNVLDAVSSIITFAESITASDKDAIPIMEALFGKAGTQINKVNKWYGYLSLVMAFMYESDDIWVENVRITVFTTDYAYIDEIKVDKSGKGYDIDAGCREVDKETYIEDGTGLGLRWGESPGAYMARRMHVGEKVNDSIEEINSEQKVIERMPNGT